MVDTHTLIWTVSSHTLHPYAHGGHTHTLIWTVSDRWDASHYIHLYCSWFSTWWTHTHWYGRSLIAGMLHTTSIFIAHGLAHGGHIHWYGQSLIAGTLHTTSIFIGHGLAHGGHTHTDMDSLWSLGRFTLHPSLLLMVWHMVDTHTLIWTVSDRWDASHYIHLYCSWFSTWWTHTHWYGQSLIAGTLHTTSIFIAHGLAHGGHIHWYGQSLIAGTLHTTSIFIAHGLAHGGHTLIWTVCDRWDASHYIHLYCSWFGTWWTHTHTDMDGLTGMLHTTSIFIAHGHTHTHWYGRSLIAGMLHTTSIFIAHGLAHGGYGHTHTHTDMDWYGQSLIAGMLHTTSIFIAHGLAHGGHTYTDMDSLWSLGCFTLHPSLLLMV